jgi:hypothetical protein
MAFSTPRYSNNNKWKNGDLTEMNDANRESALAFVNSLVPAGNTQPEASLDHAFANRQARAIYFMTDGTPSAWLKGSPERTVKHYNDINNNIRVGNKLTVNTISVGRHSAWLQKMSDDSGGTYKMVKEVISGS